MKTYEMFMEEAPQKLNMKRLYHGTDKGSSDSIDKGGYDTSKGENKLAGSGIYASKKKKIASDYANVRAKARNSTPTTKELLVPKDKLGTKKARLRGNKPGQSDSNKIQKVDLNNYLLKDKDANKFSVSKQPVIRRKRND